MTLLRFEFESFQRPWTLEPVEFDQLNLLVGGSGVGKTRILNALHAVTAASRGVFLDMAIGARWSIRFRTSDDEMLWEATTRADPTDAPWSRPPRLAPASRLPRPGTPCTFESEKLTSTRGVIAERAPGGWVSLDGKSIPHLKDTESLLSIFQKEPGIQEAIQALHRVRLSSPGLALDFGTVLVTLPFRTPMMPLETLRGAADLPLVFRALVLRTHHPSRFALVVERLQDIFPSVQEMTIAPWSELFGASTSQDMLTLAIRDAGVPGWIPAPEMSAGMLRVCAHLLELELAPPNTVMLIDEYENSLGVNCLSSMTEALLERHDIQFILTSHHPWVINNIPRGSWKIVQRDGPRVKVLNARDIPRLNTRSAQDPFILLINAPEYLESVR